MIAPVSVKGGSKPPRLLLYGTPAIGKTTFASQAPAPIFLQLEDGAGALDIEVMGGVTDYATTIEGLAWLASEQHRYRTVVIDSLSALELLVMEDVNKTYTDGQLAYGKDKAYIVTRWRRVMAALEVLRTECKMCVIIIGHSQIAKLTPPDAEAYDRYDLKLSKEAAALWTEWADLVLFAKKQTMTKDGKVIDSGERVAVFGNHASHLAKSRFPLPEQLPLNWGAFYDAYKASLKSTTKEADDNA